MDAFLRDQLLLLPAASASCFGSVYSTSSFTLCPKLQAPGPHTIFPAPFKQSSFPHPFDRCRRAREYHREEPESWGLRCPDFPTELDVSFRTSACSLAGLTRDTSLCFCKRLGLLEVKGLFIRMGHSPWPLAASRWLGTCWYKGTSLIFGGIA
jgi:hypothetical protein